MLLTETDPTERAKLLAEIFSRAGSPMGFPLENLPCPDLSAGNPALCDADLADCRVMERYLRSISPGGKAAGGWGENRIIYRRSDHFNPEGEEPRSVHLGTDIWVLRAAEAPLTPVYAVADGVVHSFRDNAGFGNYGPTIILEHRHGPYSWWTLYGHLSGDSIAGLQSGMKFHAGEEIGRLGEEPENGNWPEHLHFQVILDMMGNHGDFPGVCRPSEWEMYSGICPRWM